MLVTPAGTLVSSSSTPIRMETEHTVQYVDVCVILSAFCAFMFSRKLLKQLVRSGSNSEVSSGGIVGSSRGRGWYPAGSAAFASLVKGPLLRSSSL